MAKAKIEEGLQGYQSQIEDALKAYGVDPQFVVQCSVKEDGTVVFVTAGGRKCRWNKGMADIVPLSQIEVTGINPEAKKRKPIAGKRR